MTGFLASGCSLRLSRHDLLLGYSAERPGLARRVAPGLDLRLGGEVPGASVGWHDSTVMVPVGENPPVMAGTAVAFAPPLGWRWTESGIVHRVGWTYRMATKPTNDVRFVGESWFGLAASWPTASPGFGAGFSRQSWVLSPPGRSGAFFIDFSSRRPTEGSFIVLPISSSETNKPSAP